MFNRFRTLLQPISRVLYGNGKTFSENKKVWLKMEQERKKIFLKRIEKIENYDFLIRYSMRRVYDKFRSLHPGIRLFILLYIVLTYDAATGNGGTIPP